MNTTVLKVDNNSEFAQSFLEFVQTLPYVKIELPKVAKRTKKEVEEPLEEDEDGIPIAHRDFIMELSRDVKKGFAKKYFEVMKEKYA
ncbi:hypothetical protein [Capnocytophaga leadbetteri]